MRKATYVLLEIVFLSSIVVIGLTRPITVPSWLLPIFLIMAANRFAITVSENEIMEWLRDPFCATAPDSCGAGDSVNPQSDPAHPASKGWRRAIGGLIACPICTGTWGALILVAIYAIHSGVGSTAIVILGAAGASEFVYHLNERNSWNARLARVQDGKLEQQTVALPLVDQLFEHMDQPVEESVTLDR